MKILRLRLVFAMTGLLASLSPLTQAESAIPAPQNNPQQALEAMPPVVRGDLLMVRQQYQAAIDAYRQAPLSAETLNRIGMAYHHLLAFDEARRDYEQALLIRPNFPEAINNLGATYFAQGDYRKALRLYRRAFRMMPHSATIAANLGTAYFARGKFAAGLRAYEVAFTLDPSVFNADSMHNISGPVPAQERARQDYCLAELFAQADMRDRAIEYLRKAFDEGFDDWGRLSQDKVFNTLRKTSQFAQLMGEQKLH